MRRGLFRRVGTDQRSSGHGTGRLFALLAAVSYLPLLLTRPGQVVADTKQYLILDPGGVLSASRSLWDPDWALGTVTHQSIGYLWPMGPFFWAGKTLGLPMWLVQRLWLGSILFAAGTGVVWLAGVLGAPGRRGTAGGRHQGIPALTVSALAYTLTPYALSYSSRISVLLLAWAALPWLIGLGVRASRRGGWRDPALLGLVAMSVGSVNASSLFYAGLGVILWFPFAMWISREVPMRRGLAAMGRIGIMTLGASAWWWIPLLVQARWGPPVLQFSETLEVVASASTSVEAWRGLGYWIFYGGDKIGPWVTAGLGYMEHPWLIATGFTLTGLTLLSAVAVRWRYRAYMLMLMITGLVLTVGLHPHQSPSPLGTVLRDAGEASTVGLALRSSPRALPLFLLASALMLGVGVQALTDLRPRLGRALAWATIALVIVNQLPLFTGSYVGPELARDETLPASWTDAAAALDQGPLDSRILVVPGADFSAHRWGNTIDHVLPGLVERPVAVRELIGFSSQAASDLLIALDRRLQEGVWEPDSIAPIARLLGAGDVVVQSDLEFERYRTPRPRQFWERLVGDGREPVPPPGLMAPRGFGEPLPNLPTPRFPMQDELELSSPADLADPPPVSVFQVAGGASIVTARPADRPLLLAGDGEGLVDLAEAGLLPDNRAILYSADLDRPELERALEAGATLVVTDTNRLRGRRWKTVRDNVGYTERADGADRIVDPSDTRLELFADPPPGSYTTALQRGALVVASGYGNPISFHPESRAVMALDGDPLTAWRTAAFSDARGQTITIRPDTPVVADSITLLQPIEGHRDRHITDLLVTINGEDPIAVTLGDESLSAPGQSVPIPASTVEELTIEIVETSAGRRPGFGGLSPVGFAEIGIGGLNVEEIISMPEDLLGRIGPGPAAGSDLTLLMTRLRTDPTNAVRRDTETHIARGFDLPAARSFEVHGSVRLSPRADGSLVDAELGLGPVVRTSARLPGPVRNRGHSAFDGDPHTAWQTPFGPQVGQWIEFETDPVPGRRATVRFLADDRHSLPTEVEVTRDGTAVRRSVPADGVLELDLDATSLTRLTVTAVAPTLTTDWFSESQVTMPAGISEIETDPPAIQRRERTEQQLTRTCRSDLVEVDGRPIPVTLTAPDGLDGPFRLDSCAPLNLGPGEHVLRTAVGRDVGLDVDRLVLRSPAGGTDPAPSAPPGIRVTRYGRSTLTARGTATNTPFWLELVEGYSAGWEANLVFRGADGTDVTMDLGPARLIDGMSNGWLVDPPPGAGEFVVELQWAPRSGVRLGFLTGFSTVVLALMVILGGGMGRYRRTRTGPGATAPAPPGSGPRIDLTGTFRSIPIGVAVLTAVVVAFTAGTLTRPWMGLVAGGLTLAAALSRGAGRVLDLGLLGSVGAAAGYVLIQQIRFDIPPGGHWPGLFETAHVLGWLGLALLIAELGLAVAGTIRPGHPADD